MEWRSAVAWPREATHMSVVFNSTSSRFKRSNVQGQAPVFDSRCKFQKAI
jgi:hypothetical protein